jgi:heme O synthase-like polyprenyltransferase
MLDKSQKMRINDAFAGILRDEGFVKLYAGIIPRSLWMGIGGLAIYHTSYAYLYKRNSDLYSSLPTSFP